MPKSNQTKENGGSFWDYLFPQNLITKQNHLLEAYHKEMDKQRECFTYLQKINADNNKISQSQLEHDNSWPRPCVGNWFPCGDNLPIFTAYRANARANIEKHQVSLNNLLKQFETCLKVASASATTAAPETPPAAATPPKIN